MAAARRLGTSERRSGMTILMSAPVLETTVTDEFASVVDPLADGRRSFAGGRSIPKVQAPALAGALRSAAPSIGPWPRRCPPLVLRFV